MNRVRAAARWAVDVAEYGALLVGLRGYCWRCDHYGWMAGHRRHPSCWRGSPEGREVMQAVSAWLAAENTPTAAGPGPEPEAAGAGACGRRWQCCGAPCVREPDHDGRCRCAVKAAP